jgi:hypothetical protein
MVFVAGYKCKSGAVHFFCHSVVGDDLEHVHSLYLVRLVWCMIVMIRVIMQSVAMHTVVIRCLSVYGSGMLSIGCSARNDRTK